MTQIIQADRDAAEPCENGEHCCCCGPGEPCCGCGQIMPDLEELPSLRRALSRLLEACRTADAKGDLAEDIDGTLLDEAADALELQYPIIWTREQVALLERRQAEPMAHPYICGNRSADEHSRAIHRAQAEEDGAADTGILIPTRRGWICPACDYRQFWSHETGGPPVASTSTLSTPGEGEVAALIERLRGYWCHSRALNDAPGVWADCGKAADLLASLSPSPAEDSEK